MSNVTDADKILRNDTGLDIVDKLDDILTAIQSGGGSSTLSGLEDVNVTSPSNGQVLKYDNVSGKWINGAPGASWTDVTGTLTAGQTSITLQSAAITTSSTIEVFTEDGTEWNSVTIATGSVTITFDEQSADLGVKVRVT